MFFAAKPYRTIHEDRHSAAQRRGRGSRRYVPFVADILEQRVLLSHYRGGSVTHIVSDNGVVNLDAFSAWRSGVVSTPSFQLFTRAGVGREACRGLFRCPRRFSPRPAPSSTAASTRSVRVLTPSTWVRDRPALLRTLVLEHSCGGHQQRSGRLLVARNQDRLCGQGGRQRSERTDDSPGHDRRHRQRLRLPSEPQQHGPRRDARQLYIPGGYQRGWSSSPNFGPTTDIPGVNLDAFGTVSISTANTTAMTSGRWVYKVRVTDGSGATAERDVLLVAQHIGNRSPDLAAIGPKVIPVGTPLSFNLTGNDLDVGQTVALHSQRMPVGSTFTASDGRPATGTFNWTPTAGQEDVLR